MTTHSEGGNCIAPRLTRRCSRPAAGVTLGRAAQLSAAGLLSGKIVRPQKTTAAILRIVQHELWDDSLHE